MTKELQYLDCDVRKGYTRWKDGKGNVYTLEAGAGVEMCKIAATDPLIARDMGFPENFYDVDWKKGLMWVSECILRRFSKTA